MSSQKDRISLLLSAIRVQQLEEPLSAALDKIAAMFLRGKNKGEARHKIVQFLFDYVIRTPDNLFELKEIAKNLKLFIAVDPAFDFAISFLDETLTRNVPITDIDDPPVLLLTLLQACYLANRVIEEIDDNVESFIGIPLTPNDLVYANIIVHEVIGDSFANRLDLNLTEIIKPSVITKSLVEADLNNTEFESRRRAGQSLSGDKVICYARSHGLSLI